jgi:sulfite dehydrogenase (cytochrome) subunit B
MKFHFLIAAALVAAAAAGSAARADEPTVPLKPGSGEDVVAANCNACHSLDYIRTNAPFMTGKVWEAEVGKMINVFGAAIDPANAKTIVDYLARSYGKPG